MYFILTWYCELGIRFIQLQNISNKIETLPDNSTLSYLYILAFFLNITTIL